MTGAVMISGDAMASGGFTRTGWTWQPNCATYASDGSSADDDGEEGEFSIPGPVVGDTLEPTGDVYFSTLRIPADVYAGPGTYVNDDATTQMLGQIMLIEVPGGRSYYLEDGMSSVTVRPDGSGSVTFEDIPESPVAIPERTISGTVTWTCSDD